MCGRLEVQIIMGAVINYFRRALRAPESRIRPWFKKVVSTSTLTPRFLPGFRQDRRYMAYKVSSGATQVISPGTRNTFMQHKWTFCKWACKATGLQFDQTRFANIRAAKMITCSWLKFVGIFDNSSDVKSCGMFAGDSHLNVSNQAIVCTAIII